MDDMFWGGCWPVVSGRLPKQETTVAIRNFGNGKWGNQIGTNQEASSLLASL